MIVQKEKQMTFAAFEKALPSHEESAKTLDTKAANAYGKVMFAKPRNLIEIAGQKGHKSSEYLPKMEKWCSNYKNKSQETKNCRKRKDWAKPAAEKTTPRDTKHHEDKEHTFTFVSSDTKNNSGIYSKDSFKFIG